MLLHIHHRLGILALLVCQFLLQLHQLVFQHTDFLLEVLNIRTQRVDRLLLPTNLIVKYHHRIQTGLDGLIQTNCLSLLLLLLTSSLLHFLLQLCFRLLRCYRFLLRRILSRRRCLFIRRCLLSRCSFLSSALPSRRRFLSRDFHRHENRQQYDEIAFHLISFII